MCFVVFSHKLGGGGGSELQLTFIESLFLFSIIMTYDL